MEQIQDPRETQATKLMTYAAKAELFRTPEGTAYAHIPVAGGRRETHPIRSKAVRSWLVISHMEETGGSVPSNNAMEQALMGLEALAMYKGGERETYLRLAWHNCRLYLDLGNDVVEVSRDSWKVIPEAPVRFRRPAGQLPLPKPQRGGSLDDLRKLLNLESDKDWKLVVGWLLGTLHPTGPYPVLALHGEKGSAKSTTARFLRFIVDPNKTPVPKQPPNSQEFTLKANSNWVVAFDNMSSMPRWLSDDLCRLCTGSGDSKKQLYTDDDMVLYAAKRPSVINGIEELATEPDLLDRTMIVTLPVITERKTEAELEEAFKKVHPYILGALLDAVVVALRKRDSVTLENPPRMIDFAIWVTAAEEALGWDEGDFMQAYAGNRDAAVKLELEASPVGSAVVRLMEARPVWSGTAAELLRELGKHADQNAAYDRAWPKAPNKLSGTLRRVAGTLRAVGIQIEWGKGTARTITIRRAGAKADPMSTGDPERNPMTGRADDKDDRIAPFSISPSQRKEEREERDKAPKLSSVSSGPSESAMGQSSSPNPKPSASSVSSDCDDEEDDEWDLDLDVEPKLAVNRATCTHPAGDLTMLRDGEKYCGACRTLFDAQGRQIRPLEKQTEDELPF